MHTFRYITDPGHGWLEVSFAMLRDVGLMADQISSCSYWKPTRHFVYLEEDCDAPKFVTAYERKYGCRPQFEDVYQEDTFVRRLPHVR